MKYSLLVVILLCFSKWANGQFSNEKLIETPLGETDNGTRLFLKGVLQGIEPSRKRDKDFVWSFDLYNPQVTIEYKIFNDTCVMVGAHFKLQDGAYNETYQAIMSKSLDLNGTRSLYNDAGEHIIVQFKPEVQLILAFRYQYLMNMKN